MSGESSSSSNSITAQFFNFSNKRNKEELAKFIAVENLSFSFGEKLSFINYCQNDLNPTFKGIPRTTLKRTLYKLYKKEKKDLQNLFKSLNAHMHVGISIEVWSDYWHMFFYTCIICHWIDSEWNLQKRVLAFRIFDERHNVDNIYKLVKSIVEEYNLTSKIFSISFNNISINTVPISDLERVCKSVFGVKFFHIRCICHALNLCAQHALKSLDTFLEPINNVFFYLWGHPHVMKQWIRFCKSNEKKPKKFPKHIPTCWNSTYELLNESFEYRLLLCTFIDNHVQQLTLHPNQWNVSAKILNVLKIFNMAIHTLSGVYYPTTQLLLSECVNICGVLQDNENDEDLKLTIKVMKDIWLNYFTSIPDIYLIACVFDPRCRLDGLHDFLTTCYECLSLEFDVIEKIDQVKTYIIELYNEYRTLYKDMVPQPLQPTTEIGVSSTIGKSKIQQMWLERCKKRLRESTNNSSELESYLTIPLDFSVEDVSIDFPILNWWKQYSIKFPILAIIAKDILTSPISTIDLEQAFNVDGRVLDETRSIMSPESVEAHICVADWTKAKHRQQENIQKNNEELYDIITSDETTDGSD